jgi:hypothetical protein
MSRPLLNLGDGRDHFMRWPRQSRVAVLRYVGSGRRGAGASLVAFDPTELGLGDEHPGGGPPVGHRGVLPAFDVALGGVGDRDHRLDRVGVGQGSLELLEHVGGTQLLVTVPQPLVTHGDRQDGRTMREGGAPWCRLDRKSGVSGACASGGSCLPDQGSAKLRVGRQGGDPYRENSLPPSPPP